MSQICDPVRALAAVINDSSPLNTRDLPVLLCNKFKVNQNCIQCEQLYTTNFYNILNKIDIPLSFMTSFTTKNLRVGP